MNASFFLRIYACDYVPTEGRADWLEKHGPQANSTLLELSAPVGIWESCGFRLETDGTLPKKGDVTRVQDWRAEEIETKQRLERYLCAHAREHGRLPPQPCDVGALLEAWLPEHRAEKEANDRAKLARETEYRQECAAREAEAKERWRAERAAELAARRALLERHGTPEQIERLEAGVLPEVELKAVVAVNVLGHLPAYQEITVEDVRAECEDPACEVSIGGLRERTSQPGEMPRDEFASYRLSLAELERVAVVTPGLEIESKVFGQRGYCEDSEHGVVRLALSVTYRIAGLRLERMYALGGEALDADAVGERRIAQLERLS